MPKVRIEILSFNSIEARDFKIKFDIHVNVEGNFTTTLSEQTVELLESYGLTLGTNGRRNARKGFIERSSMSGLITAVRELGEKAVSRKLISSIVMLEYGIETACSYQKTEQGEIVPNGAWPGAIGDWLQGTLTTHATSCHPYGVRLYIKPYVEKIFQFGNGATKVEKDYRNGDIVVALTGGVLESGLNEKHSNLKWLLNVVAMKEVGSTKRIKYTEEIAGFFVSFIKMLCNFNDKIKDLTDTPEKIEELVMNPGNNLKLLS